MRFFDGDYWNEVWEAISKNRWRSFLTAMGVFWGIFILVVMSGFGNGLKQGVNRLVNNFAVNSIFMWCGNTSTPYHGFASGRSWQFNNSDVDFISSNVEGVKTVSGMLFSGDVIVSNGEHNETYSMMGHMPQYSTIEPISFLWGRYINQQDMLQRRKVCCIGQQVYKSMFAPGENPVGKVLRVGSTYYTVIGVHAPLSSISLFGESEKQIIVPFSTLQQALNFGDKFGVMAVVGADGVDAAKMQEQVYDVIRKRHELPPGDRKAVQGFNMGEQFSVFTNLLLGINFLTWFVGLGTLLAGIVGISNIMLVVTKERTHEIGIRRALGATPSTIRSQIIAESFMLTFIAGMVAIVVSVGLLMIVDLMLSANAGADSFFRSAQVAFETVISAALLLTAGGMAAGIIPANKALRVKAVDAIREE